MRNVTWAAFVDELVKLAAAPNSSIRRALARFGEHGPHAELAGLGILAAPSIDNMVARRRAGPGASAEAVDKSRLIKDKYHDAVEVGGLGMLAAPYIATRLGTGRWGH